MANTISELTPPGPAQAAGVEEHLGGLNSAATDSEDATAAQSRSSFDSSQRPNFESVLGAVDPEFDLASELRQVLQPNRSGAFGPTELMGRYRLTDFYLQPDGQKVIGLRVIANGSIGP